MNLAQLLNQTVTPQSQWQTKKDPVKIRKCEATKKERIKEKSEFILSCVTTPMTVDEITVLTKFSRDLTYNYLYDFWQAGKIKRSNKTPFLYWEK